MKKFTTREIQWLKVLHLLCVSVWIGGQASFLLLQQVKYQLALPAHQYGVIAAMKAVDDVVIVGGAIGCLLTGLLYSWMTPWGFFKHRWIGVKWAATVLLILFGTFFLGPWIDGMADITAKEFAAGLSNPLYLHDEKMNMTWGSVQFGVNLCMVAISVLKPWRRLKAAGGKPG